MNRDIGMSTECNGLEFFWVKVSVGGAVNLSSDFHFGFGGLDNWGNGG